jgi:hypothetical protein
LEIEPPVGPIPVGLPYQLRVTGYDNFDERLALQTVSWQTSDSVTAVVSPRGIIVAKQAGEVTVAVSAGGWRRASTVVAAESSASQVVLSEDWNGAHLDQWRPYGDPRPAVLVGGDASGALTINGDGSFASGVYSREAWAPTRGLGVEAIVTTPMTADRDQSLRILLGGWRDTTWMLEWDHVSGWLPQREGELAAQQCGLYVPAAGSSQASLVLRHHAAREALPYESERPRSDFGRYRVRLQIFPDGTCGLAVNGVAVVRSGTSTPLDLAYRLIAEGNSVGTEILVGDLEAWTGIRPDVDWSGLMPGEIRAHLQRRE